MAAQTANGPGGDHSPPAPLSSGVSPLDNLIDSLADFDAGQLRLAWRNHLGGTPPAHLPRWLLARVLAQRLQAATLGDFDKATLRVIRQAKANGSELVAHPFTPRDPATRDGVGLKAGALLVREWDGALQRVMVLDRGFAWNGKTYGSLSQIAKAMTGTNWNGHRFFGLRPARLASEAKRAGTGKAATMAVAERAGTDRAVGSKARANGAVPVTTNRVVRGSAPALSLTATASRAPADNIAARPPGGAS
jgi:Protein of unknown function (DUF2924)